MGLYRKKPVVTEAMQYDGKNGAEIVLWAASKEVRCSVYVVAQQLKIRTLEGEMLVSPGDWVIRGVKGEFYPCKPDIFEATYDAEDTQHLINSGNTMLGGM